MEFLTDCDICYNEFRENVTIPKILNCGHSFCESCIRNLIKTKLNCPTCRKQLDVNKAVEDYPTNYYVFSAKNIVKNESNDLSAVKSRINTLKDKFLSRKNQISADLDDTNFYLALLKNLTNAENEVIDLKTSLEVLDRLENEFEIIKLSSISRLRDSANLRLRSYENVHEFLAEIYKKLQKNELIYTVKNVDDDVKYGKVSCHGDMILFHALSEAQKSEQASLIWFDDLKHCVIKDSFFTFLKLSCDETEITPLLIIKMLDNRRATKFITHCTGECGVGYKGLNYKTCELQENNYEGILITKEIDSKLLYEKNMFIDYNENIDNDAKMNKGDIIVCNGRSSFGLYRMLKDCVITTASGKLKSPLNIQDCISFKDESKLTIIDSGIVIKISHPSK